MPVELTIQSPAVLAAMRDILAKIPELALEAMGDSAKTLQSIARGRTPYRKSSGHLKGSWSDVYLTEGGLTFENPVEYGPTLEYGLYPRVGPRTMMMGGSARAGSFSGGIYSKQAPGGILGPMIEDDAILGDAVETVTNEVLKKLERIVRSA